MKFRCAYCRQEFPPHSGARCPHCGKTMLMPATVLLDARRARERAKERIRRQAEWERRRLFIPDPRVGQKPTIVLAALSLLIIVGGLLVKQTDHAAARTGTRRIVAARRNADTLMVALERFKRDCGRYPTTREGLEALVWNPRLPGWRRYVVQMRPDPWGRPYQYRCTEEEARVFSCGPDGKPDTPDDIVGSKPSPQEVHRALLPEPERHANEKEETADGPKKERTEKEEPSQSKTPESPHADGRIPTASL